MVLQEDYYCAGEVALPIRWCAPETLHCTETTIETKEVCIVILLIVTITFVNLIFTHIYFSKIL
jgi:hypothetical protein